MRRRAPRCPEMFPIRVRGRTTCTGLVTIHAREPARRSARPVPEVSMTIKARGVRPHVALAHDYITQRGGAERVAAIMAEAFPRAPMYTTLYEPRTTFGEFATLDIRTSALNWLPLLRRDHRLALPVLAPVVSRMIVDADVLLASSSGWAHGIGCTGRKIIYCHAPARWLYQRDRYLGGAEGLRWPQRARRALAGGSVGVLGAPLRVWD